MKIAIVGNGWILKQTKSGKEINESDLIIRIHPPIENVNYNLKYVKTYIGDLSKTNIWACEVGTHKRVKPMSEKYGGDIWFFTPEQLDMYKSLVFQKKYGSLPTYKDRPQELERNIRIFGRVRPNEGMNPTIGSKCLWYVLKTYPNDEIFAYGFDFYRFSPNHYWWKKEKQGDPTKRVGGNERERVGRNFEAEEDYIRKLVKENNNLHLVE